MRKCVRRVQDPADFIYTRKWECWYIPYTMKRKRVSTDTANRVGADVWLIICGQMQRSPHVVFRLMSASKTVYSEIGQNEAWWTLFFGKVLAYQTSLQHSNFLRCLLKLQGHMVRKQKLLKMVFSHSCCFCQKRFGHRIMPLFGMRACPVPCMQQNLVSNIALHFRYGLTFSDLLMRGQLDGRRMMVLHVRQLQGKKLKQLTCDPYDYSYLCGNVNYWGLVCFFLRQDVEKAGVQLEENSTERSAAQFLSARIMRAAHQTRPYMMENIREHWYNARRRTQHRSLPSPYWMPGGAFLAVTGPYHMLIRRSAYAKDETLLRLKQTLEAAKRRGPLF